jgi:hypothetical protein
MPNKQVKYIYFKICILPPLMTLEILNKIQNQEDNCHKIYHYRANSLQNNLLSRIINRYMIWYKIIRHKTIIWIKINKIFQIQIIILNMYLVQR